MAAALSTRRAALAAIAIVPAVVSTTAVAAIPQGDQARWDRRLHEYRRLHGLMKAAFAFGPVAKANYEYDIAVYDDPSRKSERFRKAFAECERVDAESYLRFTQPADLAAMALVLTPAPDLESALLKIQIIKEHELDNDSTMPRDPFAVVEEDMRRLGRS